MQYIVQKIKEVMFYGFFFLMIACSKEQKPFYIPDCNKELNQLYAQQLNECLTTIKLLSAKNEKVDLIKNFKKARLAFKKSEPLMSFFSAGTYKNINRPNLPIVDEDDNAQKILLPSGYQVLEELILDKSLDTLEIDKHIKNITNTLLLESKNYTFKKAKKHHIIWMLKDSYLRITSLGISGFDSPLLQYSLPENKAVLKSISNILFTFKSYFNNQELYNKQQDLLKLAINDLDNKDFIAFDRYLFIKNKITPLLSLLNSTTIDWNVKFPFDRKISNTATSFFNNSTFNLQAFSPNYGTSSTQTINLGKELFNDEKLSENGKMSCATCHKAEQQFADGLKFSKDRNRGLLKRNTPTLLYSALQASQFYDARASSLETQIIGVVENDKEFHNNLDTIVHTLSKDKKYIDKFTSIYKNGINSRNMRHSIASYIRTLSKFNSKFDMNISNTRNDLTTNEITGFNLFMGKAKCATCHFAPTFNGTVPPNFTESELEVLGIPQKNKWKNAIIDDDFGRYEVFNIEKKKHAFKTPTVRNLSKTAPYMHNGVYNTLEDVIKFYNLGGGSGIGISIENQTLPSDKLNLTNTEIKQIISFLTTLNDNEY